MAETPSVENPTTSSTVSQCFFVCKSDPRSSSGYTEKNKTQAAWSMNGCCLFQAGCENITQELHFVMSNLIFDG